MKQLSELLDKDFKAVITKLFQLSIINFVDTNEKNLSKEMEVIKKNQWEIIKLKNLMRMKNLRG